MATKTKKLLFVQFPHPGSEHTLTPQQRASLKKGHRVITEWNCGTHKRKFMKAKGIAINGENHKINETELYFWGEWEPTSYVSGLPHNACECKLPKYLHEPFYAPSVRCGGEENATGCNGTNTDPFVFADNFLYSCCHQKIESKPTQLQELEPGSIIVFGSKVDNQFVMDTVFVVGESRKYTAKNARKDLTGFVPEDYYGIMNFSTWDNSSCVTDSIEFTCYKGIAYAGNPTEPFCFVPCKTKLQEVNGKKVGFERPVIPLEDLKFQYNGENLINPKSATNFKTSVLASTSDARQIWNKIKEIVLNQGFSLAVRLEYERKS